jgi:hypothetical protein
MHLTMQCLIIEYLAEAEPFILVLAVHTLEHSVGVSRARRVDADTTAP